MVFACYRLQKKFLYALVDLEVLLVKSFFHIVVMNHVFWFVLVFGCLILLCITLRMLKNETKYKCYCFKPLER